jgi:hypothetical protein
MSSDMSRFLEDFREKSRLNLTACTKYPWLKHEMRSVFYFSSSNIWTFLCSDYIIVKLCVCTISNGGIKAVSSLGE